MQINSINDFYFIPVDFPVKGQMSHQGKSLFEKCETHFGIRELNSAYKGPIMANAELNSVPAARNSGYAGTNSGYAGTYSMYAEANSGSTGENPGDPEDNSASAGTNSRRADVNSELPKEEHVFQILLCKCKI